MTLEFLSFDRLPGYAGPLEAARHPELANRFHFWRGASGRRYAATRFPLSRIPAFENAVILHVCRHEDDMVVVGIAASDSGNPVKTPVSYGIDEVHVHLVRGGTEELQAAVEDLRALVLRRPPLYLVERQAA